MNSKLEAKLLQYEKSTKITNDKELKKAIEYILEKENKLPYSKRDYDLIDEAVEALISLDGVDIGKLEEHIDSKTDEFIEEIIANPEIKPTKKQRARLKWIIPIAAIISLLLMTAIVASAFGIDLVYIAAKYFETNKNYNVNGQDVIATENYCDYTSLEEFINSDNYFETPLPTELPDNYNITKIHYSSFDEYEVLIYDIYNGNVIIDIFSRTNINGELKGEDNRTIGEYSVKYFLLEDNTHHIEFISDNVYFIIDSPSYEDITTVIESLKK